MGAWTPACSLHQVRNKSRKSLFQDFKEEEGVSQRNRDLSRSHKNTPAKTVEKLKKPISGSSRIRKEPVSVFGYIHVCPRGGAPFLEVLQYQVDAWSGWSKLLFQLPDPKIHLIYCPRIEDVSDIKLIRTDTTLDLSQKAEK